MLEENPSKFDDYWSLNHQVKRLYSRSSLPEREAQLQAGLADPPCLRKCYLCNITFPTVDKYLTHLNDNDEHWVLYAQQKGTEYKAPPIMKKPHCPMCDKYFKTEYTLERHFKTASHLKKMKPAKKYECKCCDKQFEGGRAKQRLDQHRLSKKHKQHLDLRRLSKLLGSKICII